MGNKLYFPRRKTPRVIEAFRVICEFAQQNPGATPSSSEIAERMEGQISERYVRDLLAELEHKGKIERISNLRYKIPDAYLIPPQE